MNNLPLVSIVVPSYNHEKYVEQTIKSIVNQTYGNIELIVIDDGSSDSSVRIIKKLSNLYNFKFIYRSNKGLSATLNEGIKLSQGKYWCVCASDDLYKPNKIEAQVKYMEENPKFGMSFAKTIMFDDDGNERAVKRRFSKEGWVFDELIIGTISIPAVTVMIRRNVFNNVGTFDEALWVEDWDMWLKITNKYEIGFINEYLALYREHETNISKQTWKMYQAKFTTLNKWKEQKIYPKASLLWKLYWFNMFSRNHKHEAKKISLHSIQKHFSYKQC